METDDVLCVSRSSGIRSDDFISWCPAPIIPIQPPLFHIPSTLVPDRTRVPGGRLTMDRGSGLECLSCLPEFWFPPPFHFQIFFSSG